MDDRRSFLKNTAIFGGLVLSPLGLYWPLESPVGGGIIQGGLGTLAAKFKQFRIFFEGEPVGFDAPSFMAGLGNFYLARRPEFQRPHALQAALTRRLGQPPPYHLEALAKAIIEDFEGDRLVTYQGWVMAELEAQLMAALAASEPSVS